MKGQGYYSLLQYSEQPERAEFVNIGVVLFSDVPPHALVRMSSSARRVERVFGVPMKAPFKVEKESIERRIRNEFAHAWDRGSIEKFVSLRSGKIRLSPPRSVLVSDPEKLVDELFARLVADERPQQRSSRASSKLKRVLVSRDVERFLQKRPEPVMLPEVGLTIKGHYGYQNGMYNLIRAVSLNKEPDLAIKDIGDVLVEAKWLHEKPELGRRLVVVGDVEDQVPEFVNKIEDEMNEHGGQFHRLDEIDPLIEDIRRHATIQ